jgi:hypothetical protein
MVVSTCTSTPKTSNLPAPTIRADHHRTTHAVGDLLAEFGA